jgi:hypothetical protein
MYIGVYKHVKCSVLCQSRRFCFLYFNSLPWSALKFEWLIVVLVCTYLTVIHFHLWGESSPLCWSNYIFRKYVLPIWSEHNNIFSHRIVHWVCNYMFWPIYRAETCSCIPSVLLCVKMYSCVLTIYVIHIFWLYNPVSKFTALEGYFSILVLSTN